MLKTMTEANWKSIPATMMSVPTLVLPGGVSLNATAAEPPPTAWMTREMISTVQKIQRYQTGPMGETPGPAMAIMRPRMTYIPAVKKVGAIQISTVRRWVMSRGDLPMMSVQICIRKAFAL